MRFKFILALFVLAFLSLTSEAALLCSGDSAPNLFSTLNINCTTRISNSVCYARVTDNSSRVIAYYPNTCFGEDKICINTFPDGSFTLGIYLDSIKYNSRMNYTANIICSDSSDSSINATEFVFSPSQVGNIYNPVDELMKAFGSNFALIIIALLTIIPLIIGTYLVITGKIVIDF